MARIRKARPEDLDALVALLQILFAVEEDFQFDAPKQRQGLLLMMQNTKGCVLVAEEAGRVIGLCTGQLVISTAEGGPAVLVEDVVIAPAHRGRGYARALLVALEAWAKEQGAHRLQLLADRSNQPALGLYEHLGWGSTALICLRRYV